MSMIVCPYCKYEVYCDAISDWKGDWKWIQKCGICNKEYEINAREEVIIFFDTKKLE